MSMSSWNMADDHFLSIFIVFVEPFSTMMPQSVENHMTPRKA